MTARSNDSSDRRDALLAALQWQIEAGADEAIADRPVDRFATRSSRGRTMHQSRCRPCHETQRQEQRVTARQWHAHWMALEEARRKAPPVPLGLPEELDCGPLSLR